MGFVNKLRHFFQQQDRYGQDIRQIAEETGLPAPLIRMDILWCRLVHRFTASEYMSFQAYRLREWERRTYITDLRKVPYIARLNRVAEGKPDIMSDKHLFNQVFARFIQRDWVYMPECSEDEVRQLLERNEEIIVKPVDQLKGAGIHKVVSAEALQDLPSFIASAKEMRAVVEGVIRQHPEMSAVNPSSVNTIRASTIRDRNGEVHFFAASLRGGGAGSIVDNLHAGGAQYPIDVETGIITGGGMVYDHRNRIYFHPSTHKQMIGMQIPHWDKVVNMVMEAAKIPEDMRYIGWDIAITDEGCELIEGNRRQGCNGMQLDGIGKYNIIKKYV